MSGLPKNYGGLWKQQAVITAVIITTRNLSSPKPGTDDPHVMSHPTRCATKMEHNFTRMNGKLRHQAFVKSNSTQKDNLNSDSRNFENTKMCAILIGHSISEFESAATECWRIHGVVVVRWHPSCPQAVALFSFSHAKRRIPLYIATD